MKLRQRLYNLFHPIKNDTEEFATCPKCGIDSVIGDASGYTISSEFLKQMNKYWFEDTVQLS